jgi:hypothetical protein
MMSPLVKIKENDLVLLNRQLDRLGYETLAYAFDN